MKRVFHHLLIASIATASALAQDSIVFKNGDVLTGTILERDAEHVQFETGSFGAVSLKTSDIAEIRTETPESGEVAPPAKAVAPEPAPEATVNLSQLYSNLFSTDPASQEAAAPEPAPALPAPVPAAPPPKPPGKWTGQAGLAIAMREKTDSNNSGIYKEEKFETYRIYGHVNWKGEKNNLNWNWTYRYSENEYEVRDDYFNITQKYNHNLRDGYYAEAKTVYQRDYNRRIDNEFLQTAEIGKKWFQHPRFKFSTSIGGGYHAYKRSVSGEPEKTSSPEFIFDESIDWTLINSLTLFQKYTHLGGFEKYHFIFSCGLENKLIRDVFLRLEYRLDRDTETSYDDNGYYDKALYTSLLYKF